MATALPLPPETMATASVCQAFAIVPSPVPVESKYLEEGVLSAREDCADPNEISRIAAETIAALKVAKQPYTPGVEFQKAIYAADDDGEPRPKPAYLTREQLALSRRRLIRVAS
jgi:hypothetical protein